MKQSFGALTSDQRTRFAQGYEAADNVAPFVRDTALSPAAWVDVTFAAGNVASTARDMNLNVPLYDETAYYNAVRQRLFGVGDYATDQPGR